MVNRAKEVKFRGKLADGIRITVSTWVAVAEATYGRLRTDPDPRNLIYQDVGQDKADCVTVVRTRLDGGHGPTLFRVR